MGEPCFLLCFLLVFSLMLIFHAFLCFSSFHWRNNKHEVHILWFYPKWLYMPRKGSIILLRTIHGSGRVGFRPKPDSIHQRRVEGRSNSKPTVGKIGRFGFLWWLALVGSDRFLELKKASKFEKKRRRNLEFSLGIGNSCRELENSCRKLDFFLNMHFFFSLEIVGFGRIWLNPTRYSRIWSRSL